MPPESLHGNVKPRKEAQWPGATCRTSPSRCPFGEHRPPLPASFLAYVAENGLEHHLGDTGHTSMLQPSPRSIPADQEPSIFRSFALLHSERLEAWEAAWPRGSSAAPKCPLPAQEWCWTPRALTEPPVWEPVSHLCTTATIHRSPRLCLSSPAHASVNPSRTSTERFP